jgi:hypothetical protein
VFAHAFHQLVLDIGDYIRLLAMFFDQKMEGVAVWNPAKDARISAERDNWVSSD